MDGFSFGVGLIVGALAASAVIMIASWFQARRLRRLDRKNAEAMAQIKERVFNDPYPFGMSIIESKDLPDSEVFCIEGSIVMSPSTAARVRKILKEQ